MKLIVNPLLFYFYIHLELTSLVGSTQTFIFEKLHNGLRSDLLQNYRRSFAFFNKNEHPAELPKTTLSPMLLRSPYQNIYQGRRKPNDTRVYRRRFNYEAKQTGHHVYAQGDFDCIITHLAIETTGGIPILLRGGAGYHYFLVVAKARPGDALVGSVRAYCLRGRDEYYVDHTTQPTTKFYNFNYKTR